MTAPDVTDVTDYLGDAGSAWTQDQIAAALAAELAAQSSVTRYAGEIMPDDLAEALRRRVARNLAMRNVPLGVQANELGGLRLGSTDPEVRRLEGPYRKRVVA